MLVDMLVFSLMAMGYEYVEKPTNSEVVDLTPIKQNGGLDNQAFKSNDET